MLCRRRDHCTLGGSNINVFVFLSLLARLLLSSFSIRLIFVFAVHYFLSVSVYTHIFISLSFFSIYLSLNLFRERESLFFSVTVEGPQKIRFNVLRNSSFQTGELLFKPELHLLFGAAVTYALPMLTSDRHMLKYDLPMLNYDGPLRISAEISRFWHIINHHHLRL